MSTRRKVLLLDEHRASRDASAALARALLDAGADVQRRPLAAPYDELLDALADGWLPVVMRAPPDRDQDP